MADKDIIYLERHTFLVPSDSGGQPYRVEIDAYKWGGKCGCKDHACRREPKLARGEKPSDKLRCKHVKDARQFYREMRAREAYLKACQEIGD